MNEAQFQARIVAYAELRGWLASHVENVTMAGKGGRTVHRTPAARGFPDLVLARRGEIVILEVKSETGMPSPAQRLWFDAMSGSEGRSWTSRSSDPDFFVVCEPSVWGGVVRPRHWEWIMETLR